MTMPKMTLNTRCLYCYQTLGNNEIDFHPKCSKKIFGISPPPTLPYSSNQMLQLAEQVIKSQVTVTGVQPKLSLGIERMETKDFPKRFTIMGLWGNYILKPPTELYPHLPELEDLTMHLAQIANIQTVPHSLIRLKAGQLAYITKRIDRNKKVKLHMEDMCQLTDRLTEQKYMGSYEQIGKAIAQYTTNPGLDIINFFEQVVFSFLTGNNDMHLKNFSLLKKDTGYHLCPAYDMVASSLVIPDDTEEMALHLNGKKRKLKRKDFEISMNRFGLDERVFTNLLARMAKAIPKWMAFIPHSFLSEDLKVAYLELIQKRAQILELSD